MWFDKWFKPSSQTYIEVSDPMFNPTKELLDTLKTRISDLLNVIESKDNEIELLRRENITLQAKVTNVPPPKPDTLKKYFITTAAAKSELERKSLEMKRNSEAKKSTTN